MIHSIDFRIKSWTPLMMHAPVLLDPVAELKVELDLLVRKTAKNKTPADFARIKDIEWLAGIYSDSQGRPIIPGANIEAAFCQGAKSLRAKPAYEIGLTCPENWPLIYEGPKTVQGLLKDHSFRDVRRAVIPGNGSSVMRCRPIFSTWALEFGVKYLPDIIHGEDIVKMLVHVGKFVGLCDYTPKYGRFFLESYKATPPFEMRSSASASNAKPKKKSRSDSKPEEPE